MVQIIEKDGKYLMVRLPNLKVKRIAEAKRNRLYREIFIPRARGDTTSGYFSIGHTTISVPPELVGKRIRLLVEVEKDKYERLHHNRQTIPNKQTRKRSKSKNRKPKQKTTITPMGHTTKKITR